ncbi:MAG: hypothetical protein WCV90_03570 [Candidatus Woesearchaeota archaeon]
MSVFGKLAFWKKEDDFNFDQAASQDMNQPDPFAQGFEQSAFPSEPGMEPSAPSSSPSPQQYAQASRASLYPGSAAQPSFQAPQMGSGNRDLDLINSKLDTIRAMLSAIEQRLERIEKGEPKAPPRLW